MPYKFQIFDRKNGVSYGEFPVAEEDKAVASAAFPYIQEAARTALAGTGVTVHASLIEYVTIPRSDFGFLNDDEKAISLGVDAALGIIAARKSESVQP